MLSVDKIKEMPPDFVDEIKNVKWWHEEDLTSYAKSKKLEGVSCWVVQHENGNFSRVVVRNKEVLHEDTTYEGIACFVDILWMASLPD